ncbi:MAG TPA: metal-dependent hydrolase [Gemmatimonadaceae bacterium]
MENITHSLLGATLAELALPPAATPSQRRLFFITGIVAANLPDADLLYTRITPPPLGYLLHHRGHTHTFVGAALMAIAFWLVVQLAPPLRRSVAEAPSRFWTLVGAALFSHILADWWNSYGVHPFWPFDNGWYYGDAVNILGPWFWVILGVAAAANTQSPRAKVAMVATVIALPLALAGLRMIPIGALVALSVLGLGLGWLLRDTAPRRRSGVALGTLAGFVVLMFGLSHAARAAALESLGTGDIVDVVVSPRAASPLCFSALAIDKVEIQGEYLLRRGQVALLAGTAPWRLCGEAGPDARVTWNSPSAQSLERLRTLARDNCWVRAWLQFGRAPGFTDGDIADVRFGEPGAGNFSNMQIPAPAEGRVCPPHLTNWELPRADLLSPALEN